MNKKNLIESILNAAKIHHNISTLGMKLPEAPEGAPDDIFWNTCGNLVEMFCDDWQNEPMNDKGNRNLCACRKNAHITRCDTCGRGTWYEIEQKCHVEKCTGTLKLLKSTPGYRSDGACEKHDLWHCYTHGRMGATLYWDKYWNSSNSGFSFKLDEDELNELPVDELKTMLKEMAYFNTAVAEMLKSLPEELKFQYEEWATADKEEKRHEALGYNRTLGGLLEDKNPAIVRLAKGIKKELNK